MGGGGSKSCDTPVCCNQLCIWSAADDKFDYPAVGGPATGIDPTDPTDIPWCCTGTDIDPSACKNVTCDQDPFDCSTLTAPTTGDGS